MPPYIHSLYSYLNPFPPLNQVLVPQSYLRTKSCDNFISSFSSSKSEKEVIASDGHFFVVKRILPPKGDEYK